MNIVLCDDSQEALSYYSGLIKILCGKRGLTPTITTFGTPKSLLFAMPDMKEPIDILLLDVMMPSMNGIELGKVLRSRGFNGLIVYLSASSDYTLGAFDNEAFNYVLKENEQAEEASKRFETVFVRALDEAQERTAKFITLNGITEHRNIALDSIRYFDVNKNIVTVHYNENDEFQMVSTMNTVENKLLAFGFVRIYRAYLVNRTAIAQFNSRRVILHDGTELPIGRGKYQTLLKVMGDYAELRLIGQNVCLKTGISAG